MLCGCRLLRHYLNCRAAAIRSPFKSSWPGKPANHLTALECVGKPTVRKGSIASILACREHVRLTDNFGSGRCPDLPAGLLRPDLLSVTNGDAGAIRHASASTLSRVVPSQVARWVRWSPDCLNCSARNYLAIRSRSPPGSLRSAAAWRSCQKTATPTAAGGSSSRS
jgi:hypothetical protein